MIPKQREGLAIKINFRLDTIVLLLGITLCVLSIGFQVYDLIHRHQLSLIGGGPEYDGYPFRIHYPGEDNSDAHPAGYEYFVHYTTFQISASSIIAGKLFNLLSMFLFVIFASFLLRKFQLALGVILSSLGTPVFIEQAMTVAADFTGNLLLLSCVLLLFSSWIQKNNHFIWPAVFAGFLTFISVSIRFFNGPILCLFGVILVIALLLSKCIPSLRRIAKDLGVDQRTSALLTYSGIVFLSGLLGYILLNPPRGYIGIVIGALSKSHNSISPKIELAFQPGFPDSLENFIMQPGGFTAVIHNWLTNLQWGFFECFVNWPFSIRVNSATLNFTDLIVTIIFISGIFWFFFIKRCKINAFSLALLLLVIGHLGAYSLTSLGFLLNRYFAYSIPLSLLFYALIVRQFRGLLRWGLIAFFLFCFVGTIREFIKYYQEIYNPYSSSYVSLVELEPHAGSKLVYWDKQMENGTMVGYAHYFLREGISDKLFILNPVLDSPIRFDLRFNDKNGNEVSIPVTDLNLKQYDKRTFSFQ